MNTFLALAFLFAADALGAVIPVQLRKTYEKHDRDGVIPLSILLPVILVIAVVHLVLTYILAQTVGAGPGGRTITLALSVVFGIAPAACLAVNLVHTLSQTSVNQLYGWNTARPPQTDMSRAKSLYMRGDVDGALEMFLHYARQEKADPRPLFEADWMLARSGRYDDSVAILREVTRRFQDNEKVWARATYRMADIYQSNLGDEKTARALLLEIVKRVPQSQEAHMAHGRLSGIWTDSTPRE